MLTSLVHSKAKGVRFIIMVNVLVFLAWFVSFDLGFMRDHFLISPIHLQDDMWMNLVSAAFSHNLFWHLLINMIVLLSFGPVIEFIMGTKRFLVFYILTAAASSITHCAVSYYLLNAPDAMALGASGAISGLVLLFSLKYPSEKLYIFGILGVPAILGAVVFVGIDLWGLMFQIKGSGHLIGHGAHLGGAIFGALYFAILKSMKKV